jgi:hypothetical protein
MGALLLAALLIVNGTGDKRQLGATPVEVRTGTRVLYPRGAYPILHLSNDEQRPIQSLLDIPAPMRFGEYVWNDENVPPGPTWIRVDLATQLISVFRGGHEIGSAVILFGTDGKPTPLGTFRILERKEEHRSSLYQADMPYMLRLTNDGVAIHASKVRMGTATHGCIGVPTEFARHLFLETKRGDSVIVLSSNAPALHGRAAAKARI